MIILGYCYFSFILIGWAAWLADIQINQITQIGNDLYTQKIVPNFVPPFNHYPAIITWLLIILHAYHGIKQYGPW